MLVKGRNETLLELPDDRSEHIQYRLYNSNGSLVASSTGERTQVFGLRMEGFGRHH